MILRETTKYKTKDGQARKFYGCSNYPKCQAIHGAHPDGKPLGTPGDRATRRWRMAAHLIFADKLKPLKVKQRYKELQRIMNLSVDDAHIGKFSIDQCRELIERLVKR